MRRVLLLVVAALLLTVAFTTLFPFTALPLLAGPSHMYTVGLSAKGWQILGAIGGAAAIGSIWALLSALRLKD